MWCSEESQISESDSDSMQQLESWLGSGCWITCEVEDNGLKIAHLSESISTEVAEKEEATELGIANWVSLQHLINADTQPEEKIDNLNEIHEMRLPLGDNEYFCSYEYGNNEIVDSSDMGVRVMMRITNEDEAVFRSKKQHTIHKSLKHMLMCHILASSQEETYFRFRSNNFKNVIVLGRIVEIFRTVKQKIITVDDGTGQLKCICEDSLNEKEGSVLLEPETDPTDPFYSANQMICEKLKELYYSVPTYEELKIGDEVHVAGGVSFYKNDFYIFANKLNRSNGIRDKISFLETLKMYNFYL